RRHGGDLARLVPELTARVTDVPPPLQADPESERFRLFEAVADLLTSAAQQAPVLLVLDDLQWATKPTLLLLRHFLRAAEPRALLLVGLYRDTEASSDLSEALADLRRAGGIDRITIEGLDDEGVAEFLASMGRQDLDDAGREFA